MQFITILLLVGGILCTGGLVLFSKIKQPILKLMLAFSGAFLLAITVMNVLPEIYEGEMSAVQAGGFILLGFLLQIVLDFFSRGMEHGHFHIHGKEHGFRFIIPVSLSLYIHSFLEGIPLSGVATIHNPLLWGILLHNVPIALAYTSMLLGVGISRPVAIGLLSGFALMTPLGVLIGEWVAVSGGFHYSHDSALAVATGIFLHISTTIIFESSENHSFNIRKFLAILFGTAVALFFSI